MKKLFLMSIIVSLGFLFIHSTSISSQEFLKQFNKNMEGGYEDYMLLAGCWRGGSDFYRFYHYSSRDKDYIYKKISLGGINFRFYKMSYSNGSYEGYIIFKKNRILYVLSIDKNKKLEIFKYKYTGSNTMVPARMRNGSMLFNGKTFKKVLCR